MDRWTVYGVIHSLWTYTVLPMGHTVRKTVMLAGRTKPAFNYILFKEVIS